MSSRPTAGIHRGWWIEPPCTGLDVETATVTIWPSKVSLSWTGVVLEARPLFTSAQPAADGSGEPAAYRQLASDLRDAIAAGQYPEGQRLPTEADLVASTGLSRQT